MVYIRIDCPIGTMRLGCIDDMAQSKASTFHVRYLYLGSELLVSYHNILGPFTLILDVA